MAEKGGGGGAWTFCRFKGSRLGHFVDLRGGLGKYEGVMFLRGRGFDNPMHSVMKSHSSHRCMWGKLNNIVTKQKQIHWTK